MAGGVGAWGPSARGGRGRRWPRLVLAALLSAAVAAAGATASVATLTFDAVTQNIERATVSGLDPIRDNEPLHVLVVGSDARDGLTAAERAALSLGEFEGARSDTVLLVSISADRQDVSFVSFPRDLVVSEGDDGGIAKLTETYSEGPDALVRAVREDLGFPVNHYVEVSVTGFIESVEVVGSVEVCLDEPLVDEKSGADLPAGCQELAPDEALAFVRSRQGAFGDFERIERQQQFLRGLVRELLDTALLLDPGRLVEVAREVSANVTVDDGLSVPLMVEIAQQLQDTLSGGVTMVTVPGFLRDLDDDGVEKAFVVAYDPGLEALVEDVREGRTPASRGTGEEREEVVVQLATGDRVPAAGIVESTLASGGFRIRGIRSGPLDPVDGPTAVHAVPGFEEHAEWVAAHLGVEATPMPPGVELEDDRTVLVRVGTDAQQAAEDAVGVGRA